MCVITEQFWPIRMLWSCPNCKAIGSMKKEPIADEKRILITFEGNTSKYKKLLISKRGIGILKKLPKQGKDSESL